MLSSLSHGPGAWAKTCMGESMHGKKKDHRWTHRRTICAAGHGIIVAYLAEAARSGAVEHREHFGVDGAAGLCLVRQEAQLQKM
jgi:hypothetical protein